jgi:hypothetical protein
LGAMFADATDDDKYGDEEISCATKKAFDGSRGEGSSLRMDSNTAAQKIVPSCCYTKKASSL